jgi:hypothetical protein
MDLVRRLRALAAGFVAEAATETSAVLRECGWSRIDDPRVLLTYHDCLLFLLAYPQTVALHAMAEQELVRVADEAKRMVELGGRAARRLAGSGLAWSEVGAEFSYPFARWLVHRYPSHAELESFHDDGMPLQAILRFCLPGMEDEILARDYSSSYELLAELTNDVDGSRLRWLVAQFERLPASAQIREHLFESLHAHLVIRPDGTTLSRTFVRGLPQEPFCHDDGLIRRVDPFAVMSEPLPPPRRLTRQEREHLVCAARAMLASLGRETDPITLCATAGVEYLELGRGLSMGLYWMPPGRRFPLDTHIGFVQFKNSLPVGYGGGWPFLGLCKIGLNIFEPYRGGESALLFCQVLRVYFQLFGVERFLVEPFQFGAENPEGLSSGAFWFYYRLGFRPVEARVAQLAESEVARMKADTGYRAPPRVLRRLTESDLELVLPGGDAPTGRVDPGELSLAVSEWIGRRYGGDRAAAEKAALERVSTALGVTGREPWPEPERRSYEAMSPLVALVADLERWPAVDRRGMVAIMRAKGAPTEVRYLALLRAHRGFRQAILDLIDSSPSEANVDHPATGRREATRP